MQTNVYIDGFNLYNLAVKGGAYKWLDLVMLAKALVPTHDVHRVRYFTAYVFNRTDSNQRRRQLTYLRALRTLPGVSVHRGQFRERKIRRPLVIAPSVGSRFVEVFDTEEKGSDVNLATWFVIDAHNNDFEQALVISNDSDLALPIGLVRQLFGCPVGVVNPNIHSNPFTPSTLREAATFTRHIRRPTLALCQLPNQVVDDRSRTITKPLSW